MATVNPTRQFRQSPARHALTSAALLGLAGWIAWAVATRQPIEARGFDFRDDGDRLFLSLCALAPALVGAELVWRRLRGIADITVDHRGVHVRRVFRTSHVVWSDLAAVSVGRHRFSPIGKGEPCLVLHSKTGKDTTTYPAQVSVTTEELRDAVLAGWTQAADRGPP